MTHLKPLSPDQLSRLLGGTGDDQPGDPPPKP